MEKVLCKDCKCWNTSHHVLNDSQKEKDLGICQRHAPFEGKRGGRSYTFIRIFGKIFFSGVVTDHIGTRDLASTSKQDGCWEGIKK